ncbi:GNAT family N-acetyltransferase [Chitinimonas sp. BJB300]|uniref:GNAT family N-acetyltransferase n=1 Tax=Chitinimonas sp. BJB300 TaxID=1559339 RepID=UPI000C0DBDE7|nr:GNAT family N-acetyltransferase [Chitinimonas sp. BJB300]PHV12755.1 GNAT family N-acetyltransferase [Chitinimonas sp. BJB300]TSJ90933.1 GNAT family N-acetyltransferase [Chitinimonas sp. BJB300]
MQLNWKWYTLPEFSALQWHEVSTLRQAVFVVEQSCPYPDLDALDPVSEHLLGRDADGTLQAYLRLVPPGLKFREASLGRILTAAMARGNGTGRQLVREGLAGHVSRYPGGANRIGAQAYLLDFYRSLGFEPCSDTYLEDDISHIDMRWQPAGTL